MKLKGKLGCILLAITLMLIGTWNYVGARDDNVEYAFKLQANYKNSYTDIRYRQTKKADNPWKVNMTYSAEGKGTKAVYWLNVPGLFCTSERVSNTHTVKQGSGPHYYKAWKGAAQQYVSMGAENNNNTSKTYNVSGYWDEETW